MIVFHLDGWYIVQLVAQIVLPFLVALVTTKDTNPARQFYLLTLLTLLGTGVTGALDAHQNGGVFDLGKGVVDLLGGFIVSLAAHYGLGQIGVLDKAVTSYGITRPGSIAVGERGLGRHVNHDPRSWDFQAAVSHARKPVLHRHYGPVLDQGQLGSCTGNAMAQALNTAPFRKAGAKLLTETDAVAIYSAATRIDSAQGFYPPTDTGSDGLSVAKVAKARGYISGYTHAFTVEQALGALQLSPFLFGTSWHESMFTPDSKGFVRPDGNVVGGHEVLCVGDTGKYLVFLNSWGSGWGKAGKFYLTYEDFAALMADGGDVTVPVK